jgi:hypothetical protein
MAKPPSPTWFSILQQKLSVAGVGKRAEVGISAEKGLNLRE